ncbi:hypothetical protein JSO61_001290 [Riemerella anatipestifer]|nr:hypothetical protein [Riemerella anatipestifer]
MTSNPDGVKNLITKGVKKYPLFEQRRSVGKSTNKKDAYEIPKT